MKHIHIFKNFITLFTAAAVLLVFISCEQISGGGEKTSSSSSSGSKITSLVVDSTTKAIYVDQDSNISTFSKETTTLRAMGTYCNVWIVSDNYTSGSSSSGEKISSSLAKTLAEKFDAIYPMVRKIFGDESEKIYLYNSSTFASSTSSASLSSSDTTTATSSDTWTYESSSPVYEIGSDISSITISGLSSGQEVYLAKTNTSSSEAVSSSYSRYVSEGSGLTLSTAESSSDQTGSGSGSPKSSITNFVAPVDLSPSRFAKGSRSARSASTISEVSMSDYDDTGSYTVNGTSYQKVNIVVYDIGNDYTASSGSSTGIVGYFYAKDYYYSSSTTNSVIDYSNVGKYFYIDAYYAVDYTDTVYSTLAHEFQHMINWGVKDMDQGLDPSTWYNEMMSMLSEDMMRNYLGLDYDDAPEDRLPLFERCYKDNGLEYRSTSSYLTLLSYANSYAFGAWVLRQFGGVQVLADMSSNAYVDMSSVVHAVNSVNGTSYDAEDLLKMYAEACIFNTTDSSYAYPTFNQAAAETLSYSDDSTTYTYPLEALDLWNLADLFTSSFTSSYSNTTYYKYDGPELYGYNAAYEIRPYGMTLVDVGEVTDSTVTLTFSTNGSGTEHLYIMVQ